MFTDPNDLLLDSFNNSNMAEMELAINAGADIRQHYDRFTIEGEGYTWFTCPESEGKLLFEMAYGNLVNYIDDFKTHGSSDDVDDLIDGLLENFNIALLLQFTDEQLARLSNQFDEIEAEGIPAGYRDRFSEIATKITPSRQNPVTQADLLETITQALTTTVEVIKVQPNAYIELIKNIAAYLEKCVVESKVDNNEVKTTLVLSEDDDHDAQLRYTHFKYFGRYSTIHAHIFAITFYYMLRLHQSTVFMHVPPSKSPLYKDLNYIVDDWPEDAYQQTVVKYLIGTKKNLHFDYADLDVLSVLLYEYLDCGLEPLVTIVEKWNNLLRQSRFDYAGEFLLRAITKRLKGAKRPPPMLEPSPPQPFEFVR